MYLTLKRLEAPREFRGLVGWGWGGTSSWSQGVRRRYGTGSSQVGWEGDKIWSIKKRINN